MEVSELNKKNSISRRTTLKGIGTIGAMAFFANRSYGEQFAGINSKELEAQNNIHKTIFAKVFSTPLIDTHEHLIEESDRLNASHSRIKSNDWRRICRIQPAAYRMLAYPN